MMILSYVFFFLKVLFCASHIFISNLYETDFCVDCEVGVQIFWFLFSLCRTKEFAETLVLHQICG